MVMRFSIFNTLTAIILLLSYPATAQEPLTKIKTAPPFVFNGYYEFGFGGVLFGKMGLEIEQSSRSYTATSDITSSGVLKLFVRHNSHTTVDATGHDFLYDNSVYETHYQTRKKKRYVKMVTKNGQLIEETLVPPETPERRPPVDASLKKGALDPLSFVITMRRQVVLALQNNSREFTLNVFDGRRLTEVDFTIEGKKVLKFGEQKYPTIAVKARRKLIAGFTDSELQDYDPKEPDLMIYFSDNTRLIPIRLEISLLVGKLYANLVKECRTGDSCLLGLRE